MQDAFGVDRSDISNGMQSMSKGFSPAQLKVMTRAGGAFEQRANAFKAGFKHRQRFSYGPYKGLRLGLDISGGRVQRERSLSQFPRVAQVSKAISASAAKALANIAGKA